MCGLFNFVKSLSNKIFWHNAPYTLYSQCAAWITYKISLSRPSWKGLYPLCGVYGHRCLVSLSFWSFLAWCQFPTLVHTHLSVPSNNRIKWNNWQCYWNYPRISVKLCFFLFARHTVILCFIYTPRALYGLLQECNDRTIAIGSSHIQQSEWKC